MSSIGNSLRVHQRSIHAVTLRLMQSRFTKSRFGFLVTIVEPILIISTLYAVRVFLKNATMHDGVPMAVFLTTGYLNHYAFRNALLGVARQTQLSSRLLAFPQITVIDNIFGEYVSNWMTYTCANIVLSTAAVMLTGASPPANPLLAIFGFNCGMWIGLNIGVFLGVVMRYVPSVIFLINPALRVSMFFSGAMWSADEMPQWLLSYVAWNPVFHATELLREGWTASYHSPIADPRFLVVSSTIGTALAFTFERITRYLKLG